MADRSPMDQFSSYDAADKETELPVKRARRSTLGRPNYAADDYGVDETDPEFSLRSPPPVTHGKRGKGGGGGGGRGGPSKYRGVVWHKSNSKWEARIYEGGKQKFLGYYLSEDAAAHAYDAYAVRLHGNLQKLNFPEAYVGLVGVDAQQPTTPVAEPTPSSARAVSPLARGGAGGTATAQLSARKASRPRVQPVKGTSRFRGVSWNSNCAKWRAQVWKGSEVHHLGYFEEEVDAARAYDEAVLRIRGPDAPTNFPRAEYGARGQDVHAPSVTTASRYRGVSWSPPDRAWLAEYWDGRRYQLLGRFASEAAAARGYDLACLGQHGADALTNFPLAAYEAELAALALQEMSSGDGTELYGAQTGAAWQGGPEVKPSRDGHGSAGSSTSGGAAPVADCGDEPDLAITTRTGAPATLRGTPQPSWDFDPASSPLSPLSAGRADAVTPVMFPCSPRFAAEPDVHCRGNSFSFDVANAAFGAAGLGTPWSTRWTGPALFRPAPVQPPEPAPHKLPWTGGSRGLPALQVPGTPPSTALTDHAPELLPAVADTAPAGPWAMPRIEPPAKPGVEAEAVSHPGTPPTSHRAGGVAAATQTATSDSSSASHAHPPADTAASVPALMHAALPSQASEALDRYLALVAAGRGVVPAAPLAWPAFQHTWGAIPRQLGGFASDAPHRHE